MISGRSSILQFSQLQKIFGFSQKAALLPFLQRLHINNCQCKNNFGYSSVRLKEHKIPSALSKYELFSEETAPAILDVEEERQRITYDEKKVDEFEGVNLEKGVSGIFDVEEVVELLKKEKGNDIFVVKIPPEYYYADYMVLVSGKSKKHMLAMSDFVRRLYKRKIGGSGQAPILEGKNSSIWMALDLGNIILHIFSKTGREVYDLETLWSVGKEFDTFIQRQSTSTNSVTDYAKILARLSPDS